MAKYKVEICGINTSNLRTLKNDEMIKLFKEYKQGDNSIKELLVYGNLKLVLSILKKWNLLSIIVRKNQSIIWLR